MFIKINNFIDDNVLHLLTNKLNNLSWEDGARTAGAGKSRKYNQQLTYKTPAARQLLDNMSLRVFNYPEINHWAETRRIARILFSRYSEGMFYQSHNDAAITRMKGVLSRADISFTIFLNDPEAYEGGELILETAVGEITLKEPAGTIVLYNTGLRHRVEEIRSGERLVGVGWIESLIKSPECREILQDVSKLIHSAAEKDTDSEDSITLRRVRANLLRMFAET